MFDRFRAEPVNRQILLIAAGVLLIGGLLAGAWYGFLYMPYQTLFSGLRVADAATIVAELDRRKIPYRLAEGSTAILVPADVVDSTRLTVMSEDLPLKGTVGLELFDKSDMGLTDFAQKINYQRALQGELERTIMTLDGVDATRVHLSMGEDRIFRDDQVPPKASVTVRMRKGAVLSPNAAQGVRRLVAAAVPKLDIANVVILDERGDVVGSPPPPAASAVEAPAPAVQEENAIAQYYEARIRAALVEARLPTSVGVDVETLIPMTAGGDAPAAALAAWSPGARQFPLRVTLSSMRPLDATAQATVRGLVASVTGPATLTEDAVDFAITAPQTQIPAASSPLPPAKPVAALVVPLAEDGYGWLAESAVTVILLVAILAAVFIVLRQARKPRRLNAQQRSALVLRLRAALDSGGAHAATGS
ncbi:MAG: flagellar basal-body MS-ring/collar protein FliF [Rhizomicrobium sp.]